MMPQMQPQPLYDPPLIAGDADSARRVTAPGGYEWWRFDAEDPSRDLQFTVIFFDGFTFHPRYLRDHARYLRRPTRRLPPQRGRYPALLCRIHRDGRAAVESIVQFDPASIHLSTERNEVRLGESGFARVDGVMRLQATDPDCAVDLTFSPSFSHAPLEQILPSRKITGADHRWIVADLLCEVEGTIRIGSSAGAPEPLRFQGRGYHDHHFGTGPIAAGTARWMEGRVLFDDAAYAFKSVRPYHGDDEDEVHLVESDPTGVREIPLSRIIETGVRRSTWWHGYPETIQLDGVITLRNPQVVSASPLGIRLRYDAICRGRAGKAHCEIIHPQRLGRPMLGRWMEWKIRRA